MEIRKVQSWDLFCIHTLSVPSFVREVLHTISLHLTPCFTSVPSALACCLKYYIEDVAEWMSYSKIKMNDDRTELIDIGTGSKPGHP